MPTERAVASPDETAAIATFRGKQLPYPPRMLLVVCLVAVLQSAGCRPRAPQIDFANRRYSAALRTAANTKSPPRLARSKELIDRDHASGVIGPEEYACYRAIIELAEAGRWEAAEQAALDFRRDQQR